MFSKTRVTEKPQTNPTPPGPDGSAASAPAPTYDHKTETAVAATPARRSAPSILSSDLTVTGNIRTEGDIQIEGTVEGDIRAHQLVIGETATIRGEAGAACVGIGTFVQTGRPVSRTGRFAISDFPWLQHKASGDRAKSRAATWVRLAIIAIGGNA